MISGHGNNIYQYDEALIEADFSSNIAFNNHSSQILSFLSENMESLCNYPDPMAVRLTEQIATYHGVDRGCVLVTNGSAEAFYLVAHYQSLVAAGRCRTAIATPSFSEYEDSCALFRHDISYVKLEEIDTLNLANFDSLWLASPNNPDGYRVSTADILSLATQGGDCCVVLDRAYNDLTSEREGCEGLFEGGEGGEVPQNIILIESFTKLYGIPGLRLGYVVASPDTIASLNEMRPPWSVNSLSLVAGEYILANREALQVDLEELIGESHYLQEAIDGIDGFDVKRSNCNFFLVEITCGRRASDLYNYLLERHGLLIRDCSNFRGLGESHIRIAAQSRCLNDKLINALRGWI